MILTPEWITALSTVLLLLATSIYVYFSYKLTQETIKLREVETSPFITVKIEPHNYSQMLKLEIENIGKAPAYNVNVIFDNELLESYKDKQYKLPQTQINYLPIGQKITTLIGMVNEIQNEISDFKIYINYKSREQKLFEENIVLNYKFMMDINMLLAVPLEISKLEDIKNEISKLNQIIKNKN